MHRQNFERKTRFSKMKVLVLGKKGPWLSGMPYKCEGVRQISRIAGAQGSWHGCVCVKKWQAVTPSVILKSEP